MDIIVKGWIPIQRGSKEIESELLEMPSQFHYTVADPGEAIREDANIFPPSLNLTTIFGIHQIPVSIETSTILGSASLQPKKTKVPPFLVTGTKDIKELIPKVLDEVSWQWRIPEITIGKRRLMEVEGKTCKLKAVALVDGKHFYLDPINDWFHIGIGRHIEIDGDGFISSKGTVNPLIEQDLTGHIERALYIGNTNCVIPMIDKQGRLDHYRYSQITHPIFSNNYHFPLIERIS